MDVETAANEDFGTFRRYQETSVNNISEDMKEGYDFTRKLSGVVLELP